MVVSTYMIISPAIGGGYTLTTQRTMPSSAVNPRAKVVKVNFTIPDNLMDIPEIDIAWPEYKPVEDAVADAVAEVKAWTA